MLGVVEKCRRGWEWDAALHPACVDEDIQALSLNGQQAGSALAEE